MHMLLVVQCLLVPSSGRVLGVARVSRLEVYLFNAQDLSNTAWAYATLGHAAPALLDAIAAAAAERPGELSRQHLC